ncbi:MAG: peptidoglycan-binding domain-containing protein [Alphaproteobacteria bacterium]
MNRIIAISAVFSTAVLAACQSPDVANLQTRLATSEEDNRQLRASLAQSQSQSATAHSNANMSKPVTGLARDLLPPDAKSGECYARVWVEPTYKQISKRVLVKEAGEKIEIIPATFETTEARVLVSEASTRAIAVPAVYGTKEERILVSAAKRAWKTGLEHNSAPASDAILATARKHGINLDAATPGMCFHEHYLPARYSTADKQVLVQEEATQNLTTEPVYRTVAKRILISEASTKVENIPATYAWEEERILDKPAHTVWKKGTGPIQRIDEATGEIMCLVEVPATYKTVRKRVLTSAATTKVIDVPAVYKTVEVRELVSDGQTTVKTVPAQYKTVKVEAKVADEQFVWHEVHNTEHPMQTRTGNKICLTEKPAVYKTETRRVVAQPATTRIEEIPARYETVKVQKMVRKVQERRTAIPAEYDTVTTSALEKDGHMEWRSILCKTNMTGTRISQIQQSLKNEGYNPGPIDGVIGAKTIEAVNAFQRDNDLPVDRYLNIETVRALGVSSTN